MAFGAFTIALVIITVLISMAGFNDQRLTDKLILWPGRMTSANEYYRLVSHGFIHSDTQHLFFNMFTLFFMGSALEDFFVSYHISPWLYVALYLAGIIAASLPSYLRHRNNIYYRSLGASGGVAAIIFATIYIAPWQKIVIYFLPVYSIVFGVLYLVISAYLARRGKGNVNHDAHFWGSVFGFIGMFIIDVIKLPTNGKWFIESITHLPF